MAGKNHAGLLNLFREHPGDWQLVLIGRASTCPYIAEHLRYLIGLDPRVTCIGGASPETVAAAMEAADVLLLSSHAEATPLVLLRP
jgi:glycosyltransferase involved in cell wall biosynthesis